MHKYQRGYLCAVVGSHAYPGAAVLATSAAARAGAGGIKALIPESIEGYWSTHAFPEIMRIHGQNLSTIHETLASCKAVLIGCGLGTDEERQILVKSLLESTNLPCVIDADGLNALAHIQKQDPSFIKTHANKRWILTPHAGEMSRLLQGETIPEDLSRISTDWGCTILMKGFPSVIYGPEGQKTVNESGNIAASTAGCGDVLAGTIAGLLVQSPDTPYEAACRGMMIAGVASDLLVKEGRKTILAHDIVDMIPRAIS